MILRDIVLCFADTTHRSTSPAEFALEMHVEEIVSAMSEFLARTAAEPKSAPAII
jgi:hypothetical protein